jgi:SAM-dependent methyltransferase
VAQADIYRGWASIYDQFELDASIDTWRRGIVPELTRLGCATHRILDLGAGTGVGRRLLLDAFPGSSVVCLDQSADMLSVGGIPAEVAIVADMTNFYIAEPFDFVVSGFDALNYLSPSELASCFSCVARALRTGGKLVFDYSSRKLLKYDWRELDYVRHSGNLHLAGRHRYDSALDCTRVDLTLSHDGRQIWRETHHHYTVDPFVLDELAREAGLTVLYGRNIGGQTYSPAERTHVWVLARLDSCQ